jgi:hypothetical protein
MSLIAVETDQLAVGERLPWPLYDQDHNVLMERGQMIETKAQLQSLLASHPLRELSLQSAEDEALQNKSDTENKDLEATLTATSERRFTLQ